LQDFPPLDVSLKDLTSFTSTTLICESLKPEKGKYPPIEDTMDIPPTKNQWKRTRDGFDHGRMTKTNTQFTSFCDIFPNEFFEKNHCLEKELVLLRLTRGLKSQKLSLMIPILIIMTM